MNGKCFYLKSDLKTHSKECSLEFMMLGASLKTLKEIGSYHSIALLKL